MCDDLNPEYIFNNTRPDLLMRALRGEFSLEHMARKSLASRGLDFRTGAWIGFPEARRQLRQWEEERLAPGS